jgi:hypothetical protein
MIRETRCQLTCPQPCAHIPPSLPPSPHSNSSCAHTTIASSRSYTRLFPFEQLNHRSKVSQHERSIVGHVQHLISRVTSPHRTPPLDIPTPLGRCSGRLVARTNVGLARQQVRPGVYPLRPSCTGAPRHVQASAVRNTCHASLLSLSRRRVGSALSEWRWHSASHCVRSPHAAILTLAVNTNIISAACDIAGPPLTTSQCTLDIRKSKED